MFGLGGVSFGFFGSGCAFLVSLVLVVSVWVSSGLFGLCGYGCVFVGLRGSVLVFVGLFGSVWVWLRLLWSV